MSEQQGLKKSAESAGRRNETHAEVTSLFCSTRLTHSDLHPLYSTFLVFAIIVEFYPRADLTFTFFPVFMFIVWKQLECGLCLMEGAVQIEFLLIMTR